jgi:polar amino acid transport system permease protein
MTEPGVTRRQAFEARQRRRSTTVAVVSTVVTLVALVVLIPAMPGWDRVRASFFDGPTFTKTFGDLLRHFWFDIQIFLICTPCIVVLGLLVAFARNVRSPVLYPLRMFATAFTDIMRGVPMILWITLIGFGIPGLIQNRTWGKAVIWASVALVLNTAAYVAEVFRSGIESVHESQRAAARSLGLSSRHTMQHVVLPQAIRRVVPALMNCLVSLQKDVALVSIVGAVEALRTAEIAKSKYYNFTPYVGAAILFLCVSIPLTRYTDHLLSSERRRTQGTVVR